MHDTPMLHTCTLRLNIAQGVKPALHSHALIKCMCLPQRHCLLPAALCTLAQVTGSRVLQNTGQGHVHADHIFLRLPAAAERPLKVSVQRRADDFPAGWHHDKEYARLLPCSTTRMLW